MEFAGEIASGAAMLGLVIGGIAATRREGLGFDGVFGWTVLIVLVGGAYVGGLWS